MQLLSNGKQQFIDQNGAPLAGGLVYIYAPGTTNPLTTYKDSAGQSANTNPIQLDSRGQAVIWGTGTFRQVVTDAVGTLIWDQVVAAPDIGSQLSAPSGAAAVGFLQAGAGATTRTMQDKLRDTVNVRDFGAKGDGTTNDLSAFQAAINALPAAGGRIVVPDASYLLSAAPIWGAKSIHWDFGVGVTFTGAGTGQNKFPSMMTNGGQIAVGPFIQSQSRNGYALNNGGVAAFNVEMLQPADVVGQSVALFAGSKGSNPDPTANNWAINCLIRAETGAGGTYQCIEVDVDCFSDAALVKGISINGVGSANPDVGLELIRSDTTKWNVGIDVMNAITGIRVRNTSGLQQGVIVGDPVAQSSVSVNSRQLSNGGDAVVLQRNTDTNPLGYLLRAVDAANSTSLTTLDISGNFTTVGIAQANHLTVKGAASTKPAGSFAIGSTNQQTVGAAGTAAALPSNPRAYLIAYDGPTKVGFPYYVLP